MNGTTVESGAQLRRMIRETPPGRTVTFGISREGQPQTIRVQLADRRKTAAWGPKVKDFKFDMPDMPNMSDFDFPVSVTVVHSGMRSGLMIENITPQLGDFFGVRDGKGVLVRSVEKGSRAEKSGFRAGDVIVRVNNQPVHDTSDFSHALHSTGKGTITVGIIREKREQNLTLTLPERKDTGDYFEESLDSTDLNARVQRELINARQQIARLEPQMQYAIQESRQALEKVRPEIEKAQRAAREEIQRERPQIERALRETQREAHREMYTQQRAMREQAHRMQQQWHKQHEEMMKQNRKTMERLRHEMKGEWMQI
jgi:serine protease Do